MALTSSQKILFLSGSSAIGSAGSIYLAQKSFAVKEDIQAIAFMAIGAFLGTLALHLLIEGSAINNAMREGRSSEIPRTNLLQKYKAEIRKGLPYFLIISAYVAMHWYTNAILARADEHNALLRQMLTEAHSST